MNTERYIIKNLRCFSKKNIKEYLSCGPDVMMNNPHQDFVEVTTIVH